MALDEARFADVEERSAGLIRSTVSLMAVAVATIIVSSLVVRSSSQAFDVEEVEAVGSFAAGTVELTDDDRGDSLFDLANMRPGSANERCIQVVYRGTISPAVVRLAAVVEGELGRFLDVRISRGRGGSFDDCTDFVELGPIWEGTFADLAAQTSDRPLEVMDVVSTPDVTTFRFVVVLRDDGDAMGQTATVDLVWESAPR